MSQFTRRQFIRASLAAAALPTIASAESGDDAAIIDTHTHFYDPTRPEGVPWPGKGDAVLYRRTLPADFKLVAGPLGVTGTVVVEASPWVEDNQWLLDIARNDPFVKGIVGNLAPGTADFAKNVERFARNPLYRGIRINGGQLTAGLTNPDYIKDLQRLVEHDLALDVNGGPAMLADVATLAERLPELRILVNHVANVRNAGRQLDPVWLKGMTNVAARPNVYCKVSALVEAAAPRDGKAPTEAAFYAPLLDIVWKEFGAARLVYGSNWPVSVRAASYETVLRIVREYFRAKGAEAEQQFFWRNALAAYKWPQR